MTTEHNLEVAIRLGIEHGVIDSPRESNVMATARFTSFIDAYTARILAEKDARIVELEQQSRGNWIDAEQRARQLSEALDLNAMQQEALEEVLPFVVTQVVACNGLKCREAVCESCFFDADKAAQIACDKSYAARQAISASAESVAAWKAEKLLPMQRQVASNRALLEELNNFKAILPIGAALRLTSAIHFTEKISEAYEKQRAAEVLEEFKNQYPSDSKGCFIHSICLDTAIAQLRAEAQKASPESDLEESLRRQ